ncbi:Drug resistance transporter, EmrB/QacA subfamily [Candidatus Sulfotelmatomonas gaucii]|uniref:Drug resistance transporter, EmrB/QacA subfamily n=1 Tax=Candidatus Sulfuritelmatomonas gaucii TaxID=2043161 RepID=A0A2N9LSC7_9BACT|nr:Drug resistance transporter, EmrB/QacA subfamily [Candidatus Sulfotelmatomonas gaucii]
MARTSLDGQVIPPNRWMIAIAVMSSAVMQLLDTTVVNVSLPHIAGSLSSTTEEATWVLTSYLVANAIILPVTGWLAGVLGRKRLLLLAVTGFTLSSLLCGLAPNLPMLIVFRVIQGLTGGGLQPLSQAVLLEEFPGKEQGKAMAFWSLGIIAAPIFGPTLGGFITDTWTWRWVFFINLPVGLLSLMLISQYVYDPHYLRRRKLGVDAWGIGMLVVGMGALQIMLDKGQEKDWFGSSLICWLCVFAVAGLTAFVLRELRAKDPIVHFKVLRSRTFASGVVLVTIMGFVLTGSLVLLPLFMQTLLGWTATTAGIWNSPRGIGTALCMPLVAYLLGKGWDARRLLIFGFALAGVCFFYYARMTLESGTWDIFWIQIFQGFGLGFLFVPLATLTMSMVPKAETSYATSLFNTVRNIGSSMGISFVTTLLARRGQFHQQILTNRITPSSAVGQQALARLVPYMVHQGSDPVTAVEKAGGLIYRLLQQQAALLSYADAFYLMGILFLLNIPVVLLMRGAEHGHHQREKPQSLLE